MDFCFKEKNGGMGLLEVLLAVAVFAIGIGTVAHLYIGSYYASVHSVEKNQALLLAKEGIEAVRSIRDDDFGNIGVKTDAGIEINGGVWSFKVGPDVIDEKYTRKINITEIDSETWKITVTVSWQSSRGVEDEVSLTEQMTAWREPYLIKYSLTLNSTIGGSVTTPGEGTYQYTYSEGASIIAGAEGGYVFTEWTGDIGTVATPSSANTIITMYNDYGITANFVTQ